jgi:hypothetical protein
VTGCEKCTYPSQEALGLAAANGLDHSMWRSLPPTPLTIELSDQIREMPYEIDGFYHRDTVCSLHALPMSALRHDLRIYRCAGARSGGGCVGRAEGREVREGRSFSFVGGGGGGFVTEFPQGVIVVFYLLTDANSRYRKWPDSHKSPAAPVLHTSMLPMPGMHAVWIAAQVVGYADRFQLCRHSDCSRGY